MLTEKERFKQRMYAKHPGGWHLGGITLTPGITLTEEELYAELNRIEDAIDEGRCTVHTSFDESHIEKKHFDDWIKELELERESKNAG